MSAQRQGIICAGNWILDLIHDIPYWPQKSDLIEIASQTAGIGGGAGNVSLDLAALKVGYPVIPMGCVGDDAYGETVLQICRAAGLWVDYLQVITGTPTAHTHVMNIPGDSRTFFYSGGVNDLLDEGHFPVTGISSANPKIFYLGYLNLLPRLDRVDPSGTTGAARLLSRARAAGMMTCVDLVSTQSESYAQTVKATLPEVDWLFLNEVEAARATGITATDEADRDSLLRAADALLASGLRQGCVIHSPRLSLWRTRTATVWRYFAPLPKDQIKSAVGAGDAFATGILHGLHEGWPPEDCLDLGHKAACACLRLPTASGGLPPLQDL